MQNYGPYQQPAQTVVMQRVPLDPLAGPVQATARAEPVIKLHMPRAVAAAPHAALADATKPDAKGVAIAPLPGKLAAPAKSADNKAVDSKAAARARSSPRPKPRTPSRSGLSQSSTSSRLQSLTPNWPRTRCRPCA